MEELLGKTFSFNVNKMILGIRACNKSLSIGHLCPHGKVFEISTVQLHLQKKASQSTQTGPASHNLKESSAAKDSQVTLLFPARLGLSQDLPQCHKSPVAQQGSPGGSPALWDGEMKLAAAPACGCRSAEHPELTVTVSVSPETTGHGGRGQGEAICAHATSFSFSCPLPPLPRFCFKYQHINLKSLKMALITKKKIFKTCDY